VTHPTFNLFVLTAAALLVGCGPDVSTNPAPVEVVFNVKRAGNPLSDLTFNLQPIAAGAQSEGMIEKGVAKLFVVPGTYTYYVSGGKSAAALNSIPETLQNGSMDRKLEIISASTIDIALNE
jgi:hypothetical protein